MTAIRKSSIASTGAAVLMGMFLSLLVSREARAATFTFHPTTVFEVVDGGFTGPFDGKGDTNGVFSDNFGFVPVVRGTLGETSENAEFNISGFSALSQESITSAIFQVQVLSPLVYGLGVSGVNPTSLAVRGYVGNGQPDASDFQAGTILDTVNLLSPFAGQTLSFDVTKFVKSLVSNGDSFAGFGIRAQDFGGLAFNESPVITLTTTPSSVPEPSSVLGVLALGAFSAISILKRQTKTS